MRIVLNIVSLAVLVALVMGCSKEKNDCLKSTGDIVFEDRGAQFFSQIEVYNNVNVIITQDTISSVSVEAGENLIDKVITVVEGESLVIRNENKCNWVRSYKYDINVHITVIDLQKIEHNGYGKISSTNTVQSDNFTISINGNGDVELEINMQSCFSNMHKAGDLILKGYASTNGIWASGNNWIRCKELVTDTTYVESGTSGDCFINASSKLQVLLNSSGSIYYSGDPGDVNIEIIGTGSIFKD